EDYNTTSEIWFKMLENWRKGITARFSLREGKIY
ncbi:hypothetical protein LCGC14_2701160, partial [marine sediment metagenome]